MTSDTTIHWPECAIEAALLGTFMIVACTGVAIVFHPDSPVARAITRPILRRALMGVLMGLTAIALIHSPLGRRSGAHMNPAVTLTFLMLGKIRTLDAAAYIAAQFLGAAAGVFLAKAALGPIIAAPSVNHAATLPGRRGIRAAWLGEFVIALLMMSMVLASTNHDTTAPYTGLFAGALVAAFITIEAPLSGMSMNPARTLASAVPARAFRAIWIYFSAPPLGMLAAAAIHVAILGIDHVYCAKLNHAGHARCIFRCRIDQMPGRAANPHAADGIRPDTDAPDPSPGSP